MATKPKAARVKRTPWSGYRVHCSKRGYQRWGFAIISKFHEVVFQSEFTHSRQVDAKNAGGVYKKALQAEQDLKEFGGPR